MYQDTDKSVESPPPYEETVNGVVVRNGSVQRHKLEVAVPDPWALPELKIDFTPWNELTTSGKIKRLFLHYIGKVILLLGLLYLFICSLGFLGDAFKLLGGKTAGQVFQDSEILSNPVAGLMIGVLATVLLQSSSTTTSIIVSMVAEDILTVKLAIPIVMGANIGTSVTNTIVALGQITDKDNFRRAFAGATVHDMFNWLSVIVLLPLELISGYLFRLSTAIVDSIPEPNKGVKQDLLKVITNPFTKLIIQVDKKVIQKIAHGDLSVDTSIVKHCCEKADVNVTVNNITEEKEECVQKCTFMFEHAADQNGLGWSDEAIGAVLLVIALFILCVCLIGIVKLLHSLLKGQIAIIIRKFVNANFPGKVCGYLTGYLAILIGAGLTILVQSSSIFTSSITPLVGMGVISLDRMYPLTLGANIGTTATSVLASLAQDPEKFRNALKVAFCHLFFNISGIIIFYPLPFFRPPINAAKFLGTRTEKYRWFALLYLVGMFFILPAAGFGLSNASWIALAAVFGPIALLLIIVGIIKIIQHKRPTLLPKKLRNWKFLPKFMRSLEPYDRVLVLLTGNCYFCRKFTCCRSLYETKDETSDNIEVKISDGKLLTMEGPMVISSGVTNQGYQYNGDLSTKL